MSLDVLIADQDFELAKLYCRFLAKHGFSAEVAGYGLECLRKVQQHAPHVLVLDHELPWFDAKGVLAYLREDGLKPSGHTHNMERLSGGFAPPGHSAG